MAGLAEAERQTARKAFFFEKEAKNFCPCAVPGASVCPGMHASCPKQRRQKFFGSFFQKRTACLPKSASRRNERRAASRTLRKQARPAFLKKSSKKLLSLLSRRFPRRLLLGTKVFWFFFPKKNCLACFFPIKLADRLCHPTKFFWHLHKLDPCCFSYTLKRHVVSAVRDSRDKSFSVLFSKKGLLPS